MHTFSLWGRKKGVVVVLKNLTTDERCVVKSRIDHVNAVFEKLNILVCKISLSLKLEREY